MPATGGTGSRHIQTPDGCTGAYAYMYVPDDCVPTKCSGLPYDKCLRQFGSGCTAWPCAKQGRLS